MRYLAPAGVRIGEPRVHLNRRVVALGRLAAPARAVEQPAFSIVRPGCVPVRIDCRIVRGERLDDAAQPGKKVALVRVYIGGGPASLIASS